MRMSVLGLSFFLLCGCAAQRQQEQFGFLHNSLRDPAFFALEHSIKASAFEITLDEKARLFENDMAEIFLTQHGIVASSFNTRTRDRGSLGDAAIWTGVYLGAESLRFAATGEPAAKERALRALKGLFLLQDVAECKGCFARAVMPYQGTMLSGKTWRRGKGPFVHLQWLGPPSVDSYIGVMFGYVLAHDLLEDEAAKEEIRRRAKEVAEMIVENDFHLVGSYGAPVVSGDLDPLFIERRLGHVYALSFLKIGSYLTQDKKIEQAYSHAARRWAEDIERGLPVTFGLQDYNTNNLYFLAMYNLVRLAQKTSDPFLPRYQKGLERSWDSVKSQRNSFEAYVSAALEARVSPQELARAAATLKEFPYPKFSYPTHNSARLEVRRRWLNYRFWKPKGFFHENRRQIWGDPLPLYRRTQTDYEWKSNPYRLDDFSADSDEVYSGVDFLAAYWMARYHGFL